MKRDIYKYLLEWKKDVNRKPLILKGARQVGKTYILKKFGENEYQDIAYFNFEENPDLRELFNGALTPVKLVEKLSIDLGRKINPEKTLIIFDEIQESPEALTSLKYFYELSNEYHVIASGSLLGIKLGQQRAFPVGKVNLIHLYPLSFGEYLKATGNSMLYELIENKSDFNKIEKIYHNKLINELKMYFFIGGMPEAVKEYFQNSDLNKVRKIQKEILHGYEEDFAKHASKSDALKIINIWNAVPKQLSKENKKFIFSELNKNARFREYNEAIQWLVSAGYIYKSYRVSIPKLPLKGYFTENIFKLFLLDVGLLSAMLNLTQKTIIEGNKLFSWYNGIFTENYVAQELVESGQNELYYWASADTAEVDFVITYKEEIIPLEVKSGVLTKAKSLKVYDVKYNPSILFRTSQQNFNLSGKYRDYPLYAISCLSSLRTI